MTLRGPLGCNQRGILRCLVEYGPYTERGGWGYGPTSETIKTLDRLILRGLVRRRQQEYVATDAGREEARRLFPGLRERAA